MSHHVLISSTVVDGGVAWRLTILSDLSSFSLVLLQFVAKPKPKSIGSKVLKFAKPFLAQIISLSRSSHKHKDDVFWGHRKK